MPNLNLTILISLRDGNIKIKIIDISSSYVIKKIVDSVFVPLCKTASIFISVNFGYEV